VFHRFEARSKGYSGIAWDWRRIGSDCHFGVVLGEGSAGRDPIGLFASGIR
jgi:hypothetical protein